MISTKKFLEKNLNLPQAVKAVDYHDFKEYISFLERIIPLNIKYEELGCYNKEYHAIFFVTKNKKYHEIIKFYKEIDENKQLCQEI